MQAGDRFVSIDGYSINCDRDLSLLPWPWPIPIRWISRWTGMDSSWRFNDIQLQTTEQDGQQVVTLDFYVMPLERNVGTVLQKAFTDTWSMVKMVWVSLVGLVTGRFGLNEMAGPVGMAPR